MKKIVSLSMVIIGLLGVVQSLYGLETTSTDVLTSQITEVGRLRAQRDQKLNAILAQVQTMIKYLETPEAKKFMSVNDYKQAITRLDGAVKSLLDHVGSASVKELAAAEAKILKAGTLIVYTPGVVRVSIPGAQ